MLNSDPKRLRFLGIDLRSRTPRRLAVVLTYGFYMTLMAEAPIHVSLYGRDVMWVASLGMIFFGLFGLKGPVKFFDGGYETEMLDERELSERNRASYLTLRFMALMMFINAMNFTEGRIPHHQPDDLIGMMLVYMVVAMTLPKAIILWTTADPRIDGELGLLGS